MNNNSIGFVILNYCTWDETLRCAKSILETECDAKKIICVVDNNSPVQPPEQLLNELKSICSCVIFNKENRGYNAGNNVGLDCLKQIGADYYVIINSDVVLQKDSISQMMTTARKDENIGIVGPNVIERGKVVHYGCNKKKTLRLIYLTTTFLGRLFRKSTAKLYNYERYAPFSNGYYHVFSVSGSCFLMTKKCFEGVYPFDDTRKLYNEENILGIKMEKLGMKVVVCSDSYIYHEHGISTKKNPALSFIEKVKSDYYYIRKYLNKSIVSVLPLLMIRRFSFFVKKMNKSFNPLRLKFPSIKELNNYNS